MYCKAYIVAEYRILKNLSIIYLCVLLLTTCVYCKSYTLDSLNKKRILKGKI